MKKAYIYPETTVTSVTASYGLLLPASPGGSTGESYSRRSQEYEDEQDVCPSRPKDIWEDDDNDDEQTP